MFIVEMWSLGKSKELLGMKRLKLIKNQINWCLR
jgi:hypothetical protein